MGSKAVPYRNLLNSINYSRNVYRAPSRNLRHRTSMLQHESSLTNISRFTRSDLLCSPTSFGKRTFASGSSRVVNVPTMGDSITEGTLNEWKKKPGDFVERDEIVAVIDTDKVSVDINSPESGTVASHKANAGDTVLVGSPLFELQVGGQPTSSGNEKGVSSNEEKPKAEEPPENKTPQSKPTSQTQQSQSITTSQAQQPSERKAPPKPEEPSPRPVQNSQQGTQKVAAGPSVISGANAPREDTIVPMNRLRVVIAERLKQAQNVAASLTTLNECDMGNLLAMRSELNPLFFETHKVKFGFVSAFLYASARSLMQMPHLNGYINETGKEIVYKNYVDISVAVATPTGEKKTMLDLEKDLVAIADKARTGKIALEDMAGGTFTISNGGVFGSLFGTPILNTPQSMHSIKDRAVVKDGEVIIRPIMYLALTYDHRIVDGREAVTFLNKIKDKIEDPRRLLLNL